MNKRPGAESVTCAARRRQQQEAACSIQRYVSKRRATVSPYLRRQLVGQRHALTAVVQAPVVLVGGVGKQQVARAGRLAGQICNIKRENISLCRMLVTIASLTLQQDGRFAAAECAAGMDRKPYQRFAYRWACSRPRTRAGKSRMAATPPMAPNRGSRAHGNVRHAA